MNSWQVTLPNKTWAKINSIMEEGRARKPVRVEMPAPGAHCATGLCFEFL